MEFEDTYDTLMTVLHNDFYDYIYNIKSRTTKFSWVVFINNKHLGIVYDRQGLNNKYIYKIVDSKKWAYNRLKHGI